MHLFRKYRVSYQTSYWVSGDRWLPGSRVHGLKFLVCNQGFTNSQLFESKFDPNKHDAVMAIFYKGPENGWTISMYSPDQKQDVSIIAKKMGGGGHPCACGFQVKDLNEVFKV